MSRQARLGLDPAFQVGSVDPRLFGSFVEHVGRCVWRSIETNRFGLSEFVSFTGKVGAEPMLAVNLGTRGTAEAVQLLEYANHPGGTARSDLRGSHGDKDPYGIRLWCLGNEMDGPWQIGHKTADEYGRLAATTAWAMRLTEPDLQLVACGSSSHAKKIGISFDEWNVWYSSKTHDQPVREWTTAPRLLEDVYSVTDAVAVGSLLIGLLRHADRVGVACLAQLVNAIAPIMTEPGGAAWRQATFYPFALTSRYGRGTVLVAEPESPAIRTAGHGDVPAVHATAVMRDEDGTVTLFAVNRDRAAPVELLVEFRGMRPTTVLEHQVIADPDEDACNTAEQPGRVTPTDLSGTAIAEGSARVVLPPMSWNIVRFGP